MAFKLTNAPFPLKDDKAKLKAKLASRAGSLKAGSLTEIKRLQKDRESLTQAKNRGRADAVKAKVKKLTHDEKINQRIKANTIKSNIKYKKNQTKKIAKNLADPNISMDKWKRNLKKWNRIK
jgi:hypothetical protein